MPPKLVPLQLELRSIRTLQVCEVLKFPLHCRKFGQMTALHRLPRRFTGNKAEQKSFMRFGQRGDKFTAQPFPGLLQFSQTCGLTGHPGKFVFVGRSQIQVAGEQDFMHRAVMPGQIANKALHDFRSESGITKYIIYVEKVSSGFYQRSTSLRSNAIEKPQEPPPAAGGWYRRRIYPSWLENQCGPVRELANPSATATCASQFAGTSSPVQLQFFRPLDAQTHLLHTLAVIKQRPEYIKAHCPDTLHDVASLFLPLCGTDIVEQFQKRPLRDSNRRLPSGDSGSGCKPKSAGNCAEKSRRETYRTGNRSVNHGGSGPGAVPPQDKALTWADIMANATPRQRGLAAHVQGWKMPGKEFHRRPNIQRIIRKHEKTAPQAEQPSRPNVVGRQGR
ncbi:hypothetical protein OpiT1DRAFT_02764 [Opitutaceae bacterium TAV1]|nr:hypothetical protein OpiT1DRAFT_02764 [Opitutaceae bacterium TAV1]